MTASTAPQKKPKENKEEIKVVEEDTPEYQEKIMFIVSTTISCFLTFWCLCVLTLGYVKLPTRMFGIDIPADQPRIDSTFAAGLLGNLLSSAFGITIGGSVNKKKKNGDAQNGNGGSTNGKETVVRIEQPLIISAGQATATKIDPITQKPIDPVTGKLT
tara:strand:+ start:482 stop:958 length:477 start_codon:yes stop_codon:yes gene_type:complete